MATPEIDDLYEVCAATYSGIRVSVVRGNILNVRANVIVNPASQGLQGGSGLDGQIHAAAGPGMAAELALLPLQWTGSRGLIGTAYTSGAYNMVNVGAVVHCVGPDRRVTGEVIAQIALEAAYERTLSAAAQVKMINDISVVIPSISTGTLAFPPAAAAQTAVDQIFGWINKYCVGNKGWSYRGKIGRILIMVHVDPDNGIDADPNEAHYITAFT